MNRLLVLYKTKLATKQFLFLFAVVSVLFSSLAWKNHQDAEKIMKEKLIADSKVIVNQTNQLLNAYIENIQNLLQLLANSQETFLAGDEADIQKTFRALTENVGSVAKTLYFMKENGDVHSSQQTRFDIFGNLPLLEQYRSIRENYGAISWSEPYDSPVSGRTVAFVRPVTNKQQQTVGTAVVEINADLLTSRLATLFSNENQSFAIMTSRHQFVGWDMTSKLLPFEFVSYQKQLKPAFVSELFDLSEGANEIEAEGNWLIAVKSQSNRLNWRVITFTNERYFYKNIQTLNQNYMKAAVFWFIILFFAALVLSRFSTKPIRMLVSQINRIREFETIHPVAVERQDEIGQLARSYNKLLDRVQTLIKEIKEVEQKKKEYELKMLQSQIGPHFLYNTLACVRSLAKQGKMEEVRETLRSLIGLLRFSFDKTSEYVSLEEELDGLRRYVQIQKVRYGDQFHVVIDVDPELLPCRIVKLTLQPIVENAIYHGIAPKGEQGTIHITGRITPEGNVKLYVVDDGVGIMPEYRRSLFSSQKERFDHSFNSVGLGNVHDRLRLHFGKGYGIKIGSRRGVGTVVRILIPSGLATRDET